MTQPLDRWLEGLQAAFAETPPPQSPLETAAVSALDAITGMRLTSADMACRLVALWEPAFAGQPMLTALGTMINDPRLSARTRERLAQTYGIAVISANVSLGQLTTLTGGFRDDDNARRCW